ncbi:MAG: SDR family NAD(P)-dependent oxidoreductase [Syntrophomonadaceae bacterium]
MTSNDLKGKTALVTGSSRGIGKAIALGLSKAGADIAIHYNSRKEEAEKAASQIREMGRHSEVYRADMSQSASINEMIKKVLNDFGAVDILINNAGIAQKIPPQDITEDDWDRMLDVNLKSAFLLMQALVPGMQEKGWGRIVNISSVAAQTGGLVGPHYAASKAGLIGLTHFFARHLVKDGITVNAVAPALIETDMVKEDLKAKPAIIPMGRYGKVDETASIVLMLIFNGYITGQTINPNGGLYMSS